MRRLGIANRVLRTIGDHGRHFFSNHSDGAWPEDPKRYETRIPPPGRSVPWEMGAPVPSDEERHDNWIAWITAKRTASMERLVAAMAKLGAA